MGENSEPLSKGDGIARFARDHAGLIGSLALFALIVTRVAVVSHYTAWTAAVLLRTNAVLIGLSVLWTTLPAVALSAVLLAPEIYYQGPSRRGLVLGVGWLLALTVLVITAPLSMLVWVAGAGAVWFVLAIIVEKFARFVEKHRRHPWDSDHLDQRRVTRVLLFLSDGLIGLVDLSYLTYRKVAIAFVVIAAGIALLTDFLWFPLESIETADEALVGYVVQIESGWASIMLEDTRKIVIVPADDIEARRHCVPGSPDESLDASPSLLEVMWDRERPQYPPCND